MKNSYKNNDSLKPANINHPETLSHHVASISHIGTDKDPHEYELVENWQQRMDERSLERLLHNHQKLIRIVVNGYRGYGLPLDEMIAEAHVGFMHAAKNFDIEKGFKFSTYAVWWIKASIQELVFKSWSLISQSSSTKHKRMFFKLRSLKHKHGYFNSLSDEQAEHLAQELEVTAKDILTMNAHLSSGDLSLNKIRSSRTDTDGDGEWQDWLEDTRPDQETYVAEKQEYERRKDILQEAMHALGPRDKHIVHDRKLKEPPRTLEDLGNEYNISKERVRQLEGKALRKLQEEVKRLAEHHNLIA